MSNSNLRDDYCKKLIKSYESLKLTGLPERQQLYDLKIEDVFVQLKLLVTIQETGLQGTEESKTKNIEIAQTLLEHKHICITGVAGSGKTTLLRWLSVMCATEQLATLNTQFTEQITPFFLELRRFHEHFKHYANQPHVFDLVEEISSYLSNDSRFKMDQKWTSETLKNSECWLILDGFDEIADSAARSALWAAIEALINNPQYNKIHCILSSRPHGFQQVSSFRFLQADIRAFHEKDMELFIQSWYRMAYEDDQAEAERLIETIENNPRIKELATNPLLCTLVTVIYRNKRVLPNRRVELYETCCESLLDTWERNKEIKETDLLELFNDWQTRLALLKPLAYHSHQKGDVALSEESVITCLVKALHSLNLTKGQSDVELETQARKFVAVIRDRSGLLQGRGDGTLEFTHRTFQEYLAARYLADTQTSDVCIDEVMQNLHSEWWSEVYLLLIGHLGSANSGIEQKEKAEKILLQVLKTYSAPTKFLNENRWFRKFGFGYLFPRWQWQQRAAYLMQRELDFVIAAYQDCAKTTQMQQLTQELVSICENLMSSKLNISRRQGVYYVYKIFGNDNKPFLDRLTNHLTDEDVDTRYYAIIILLKAGKITNQLIVALSDLIIDETYRPSYGISALDQLSIEDIHTLMVLLDSENQLVQFCAASRLIELENKIGTEFDQYKNRIIGVLNALLVADDYESIQINAAEELINLGENKDKAISVLKSLLFSNDDEIKLKAAKNLVTLQIVNDQVVDVLLDTLMLNKDFFIAAEAVTTLGKLQKPNDKIISALTNAVSNNNLFIIGSAIRCLHKLDRINEVLLNVTPVIQLKAVDELIGLDNSSRDLAIKLLCHLITNEYYPIRFSAANRLLDYYYSNNNPVFIGGRPLKWLSNNNVLKIEHVKDEIIAILKSALQCDNVVTQIKAAECLIKQGEVDPLIEQTLFELLNTQDIEVQIRVVKELVQLKKVNDAVILVLFQLLKCDDVEIQLSAAQILVELNQINTTLIDALIHLPLEKLSYQADGVTKLLSKILNSENCPQQKQRILEIALVQWLSNFNVTDDEVYPVAMERILEGQHLPYYSWKPRASRESWWQESYRYVAKKIKDTDLINVIYSIIVMIFLLFFGETGNSFRSWFSSFFK